MYIGGQSSTIQGERQKLGGYRCFTAAYCKSYPQTSEAIALLDSGAFSDPIEKRKTPETALLRQLKWEQSASQKLGVAWQSEAIASYDLLIDEVWTDLGKFKRRWSVNEAWSAVKETVDAASYLASQRSYLAPRHLVLGCQGVDADQYRECTMAVLGHAAETDWIGLGGWCILGRMPSWIPTYWETLHQVMPLIAQSSVKHVHLYGSLLDESLAPLLWFCDRLGLTCSADSKRPVTDVTYPDPVRAGVRRPYWKDNVRWWQEHLENMRDSKFYREPPRLHKQLILFA